MTDLPILDHPRREADDAIRIRKPPEEAIRDDGSYSPADARPDCDLVDAVIETAIAEDAVIDFAGRVGARPYFRYTPYWNDRGARNPMWSGISFTFKAAAGVTMLTWPRIIDWGREPANEYNVYLPRYPCTEWMWSEVRKSSIVYLRTVEASPFGGDLFDWYGDPRKGGDA